jgi:hypothetical protein
MKKSIQVVIVLASFFMSIPCLAETLLRYEDYKVILEQVKKEDKYRNVSRLVPGAEGRYERTIQERPSFYATYAPHIRHALKAISFEKTPQAYPEENLEKIKLEAPNPETFEAHIKLVKHILAEKLLKTKIKYPQAFPLEPSEGILEQLEFHRKNPPVIPYEELKDEEAERKRWLLEPPPFFHP